MHVPGKIEQNVTIIDLGGASLFSLPVSAILNIINVKFKKKSIKENFTGTMEKTFILNASYFIFSSIKMILSTLHPIT